MHLGGYCLFNEIIFRVMMGRLLEGMAGNNFINELANIKFLIAFIQEINLNTVTPYIDAVTSNI
jgi:hypothetical protein